MSRLIPALLILAACGPDGDPAAEGDAAVRLEEGSPDAIGVLAMLNDASTTVAVLDIDAKLDSRAAKNLIAHRDGGDPFGSVAEVDAVPWVGDATLDLLVDFARAGGWVPADEDFYGVIEGVELTVDQAAAIVHVANTASFDVLDVDVGLDSRAATNLVAQRPFDAVEEVAAVSYVGKTALQALADWGMAHPPAGITEADALAALEVAVEGLWYTSESDYPLEPWSLAYAGGPITVESAKTVLGPVYEGQAPLADATVEISTLGWAFDRYTIPKDWWEDHQHAELPKWQELRDIFERDLTGAQVLRIGTENGSGDLSGEIEVFIFGTTSDGHLVGVRTVVVET